MGTVCEREIELIYLVRESKVQRIGVYDTDGGIKPRPGVTHLLSHGNSPIFYLFVLHSLTQMQS